MGRSLIYVFIAGLILGLSGCEFKPVKKHGEDDDQATQQADRDSRYGVDEGGPLDIKALDDPARFLGKLLSGAVRPRDTQMDWY